MPDQLPAVFPWAVCLGSADVDPANRDRSLEAVRELGATYVRFDIAWSLLETAEGSWDVGQQLKYTEFISACKAKNLGIIAVVGAGGNWPKWAVQKYDCKKWGASYEAVREDWSGFFEKVATYFGGDIDYYQILNEENHFYQERVRRDDECRAINDARGALEAGSRGRDFETIVNVHTSVPAWEGWRQHVESWLEGAGDSIDILAIDHYPGTYTWVTGARDWAALDQLLEICNSSNKKGAIMETGFSSWGAEGVPWCFPLARAHDEEGQADFIRTAFPIIREKASAANDASDNRIVLGAWYTLKGSGERASVGVQGLLMGKYIEPNFGILDQTWAPKRGYTELQEQIKAFY